jgi:hypothetical protein
MKQKQQRRNKRRVIPKYLKNLLNAESSERNKKGGKIYLEGKCW